MIGMNEKEIIRRYEAVVTIPFLEAFKWDKVDNTKKLRHIKNFAKNSGCKSVEEFLQHREAGEKHNPYTNTWYK